MRHFIKLKFRKKNKKFAVQINPFEGSSGTNEKKKRQNEERAKRKPAH